MHQSLHHIRQRLDAIDEQIIGALAQRQDLVRQAGALKAEQQSSVRDPKREREILQRLGRRANKAGVDPSLVTTLYRAMFDHFVAMQEALQSDDKTEKGPPSANGSSGASSEATTGADESEPAASDRRAAPEQGTTPPTLADKPYRLAARAHRSDDSVVRVGDVLVGGQAPVLIGGPCSVESREQVMACAASVRQAGGHLLRGGCFKPRTSPYSFQGLGQEGLELLQAAGHAHNLPVVTEVLHPGDVGLVARHADVLQIGARNMQNFALLKAAGQTDHPVLLKRGMMATIDEWLGAAEYVLAQGNRRVILCQRGIRTFETATRYTLDLTALPVVRERTHLPIIVDPSHASGTRRWVTPLAEGALAAGADGVMVEMHPDPDEALSDGPQSLTFDQFAALADRFHAMTTPALTAAA